MNAAKERSLTRLLQALNDVLANGARAAAGVTAVRPDFSGHRLCDSGPSVQGLHASAPFHPTAAGELAVALADEQTLHRQASPVPSSTFASGLSVTSGVVLPARLSLSIVSNLKLTREFPGHDMSSVRSGTGRAEGRAARVGQARAVGRAQSGGSGKRDPGYVNLYRSSIFIV